MSRCINASGLEFFFFFWVRKNTASLGLEVYPILYFCLKGKKERKRNARIISWALHNKDCNPKGSWSESHSKWCLRSVGFRCSGVLELPPDQHHYLAICIWMWHRYNVVFKIHAFFETVYPNRLKNYQQV